MSLHDEKATALAEVLAATAESGLAAAAVPGMGDRSWRVDLLCPDSL